LKSLRSRLLVSYTLVILVCLAVVGLAMGLLLARRSLPEQQIYRDLENKSRWVHLRPALSEFLLDRPPERLAQGLQRVADILSARVMMIEEGGRVVADTGDEWVGHNLLAEANLNQQTPDLVRGVFRPAGTLQRWLFVGRALPVQGASPARWVVLSQQAPRLAVFQLFGENLLRPLAQAGTLALVLSVLLAWLISRSVARPIQGTAAAARAMAAGDYDQQLPLSGPAEVQELAASFNRMARQVKSGQQAQRDFVANVSHDLKTPLTSIQGFSQAILDGTATDPEEARRAAGIIHDEAGRMRRMVDDLLLLARMDAGELQMDRQAVDLAQLLASCVARLEPRAQGGDIALSLSTPPSELPSITGDGDRLVQLFTNLLDNALKHTPAGGRVTVTASASEDQVLVSVADTGPGIPADQLARIFERFYQVDKSRARTQAPGVGLGLAICKELAAAHGGRITAESVVGVGTKFSVTLPTADAAPTVARRRT
jgi:two-component system OmpR family sensor kinase